MLRVLMLLLGLAGMAFSTAPAENLQQARPPALFLIFEFPLRHIPIAIMLIRMAAPVESPAGSARVAVASRLAFARRVRLGYDNITPHEFAAAQLESLCRVFAFDHLYKTVALGFAAALIRYDRYAFDRAVRLEKLTKFVILRVEIQITDE